MELLTGREAALLLRRRGLSLAASQHLLSTGVAGRPMQKSAAHLFDKAAVTALADRGPLDPAAAAVAAPTGYVIARLPRDRAFSVDAAFEDQRRILSGPWRVDLRVRLVLVARLSADGALPLILTASGFAVGGAEIVDALSADDECVEFDLAPPGTWYRTFAGRVCVAGRGRQTQLLGWPIRSGRAEPGGRPLQQ